MSFVIQNGKEYLHTSGRTVVVRYCDKGIYSVTDNTGKCFSAFASELQPIEKIEQIEENTVHIRDIWKKPAAPGHQTIMGSIAEAWFNVAVGFSINFCANMLILPLFGFHDLTLGKNLVIGLLYTVISLVRSFVIRRYFNGLKWGNK